MQFNMVCTRQDLVENSGICVLWQGEQVAIFWHKPEGHTSDGQLFAIANYDPIGQANVLSRGILGSVGERLVVASPLYKQQFCLQSGQCLQEPARNVAVYPCQFSGDLVLLAPACTAQAAAA